MAKKNNLNALFQEEATKKKVAKKVVTKTAGTETSSKKSFCIYVDPKGVKTLDLVALENDFKNRNAVIEEAFNDLLVKYGKPPIF